MQAQPGQCVGGVAGGEVALDIGDGDPGGVDQRPAGGEAQSLRAVFEMLEKRYG